MRTMGESVSAPAFASLSNPPVHWSKFAISFLAQAVLLVIVAKINLSLMAPVLDPVDTHESVHLVAPVREPRKPEPEQLAEVKVKKIPTSKPVILPTVESKTPERVPSPIQAPKVEVAKLTPPPPPTAKPEISRNPDFAPSGSSAIATVHKPIRQVQTGGFGDPNGVPPNPNATGKGPMIAQVGAFDVPPGSGNGNGAGGTKGVQGKIASTGFGNGIAGPGDGGSGVPKRDGSIRSTNFGSPEPPATEAPKRQVASVSAKDTPVSLLSKPIPSYTTEARQRKIEGDVELEVEFAATGQVHVIRVIQGLGYGLDEAAMRAAEKIRFAPARHDGQAVDAEGRLKIIFRLS